MIDDYSELKGEGLHHPTKGECFVAGIDFNFGITIKDTEKQSDVFCLDAREWGTCVYAEKCTYDEMFAITLHQIYGGIMFTPAERDKAMGLPLYTCTGGGSQIPCAFGA